MRKLLRITAGLAILGFFGGGYLGYTASGLYHSPEAPPHSVSAAWHTAASDSHSKGSPSYHGTDKPVLLGYFGGGFNYFGGSYLVQQLAASDATPNAADSDIGQPASYSDSSPESSPSYQGTDKPVLLGYFGGGFNNIGSFYLAQE